MLEKYFWLTFIFTFKISEKNRYYNIYNEEEKPNLELNIKGLISYYLFVSYLNNNIKKNNSSNTIIK